MRGARRLWSLAVLMAMLSALRKQDYPAAMRVWERIRAGNGKHCFPDCGLLLLDCRESGPFKVVCAGHGGCGIGRECRIRRRRHGVRVRG